MNDNETAKWAQTHKGWTANLRVTVGPALTNSDVWVVMPDGSDRLVRIDHLTDLTPPQPNYESWVGKRVRDATYGQGALCLGAAEVGGIWKLWVQFDGLRDFTDVQPAASFKLVGDDE